ncbi:C1 family peptidase [Paenibacillus sp. RC21]|uniref:C1 family peptidase n=1 Tax=Paenibacillus sp. RC21 TaxID=3156312 RepID=UPI0038351280
MSEVKGLGLTPSPIDKRDILMSSILPPFIIPSKFEVKEITPVRDQGHEGTCVGFSCAVGMKEWQERDKHVGLSPRYLYEKAKAADTAPDNTPRCTTDGDGTSIRVAMDILKKQGVCEESFWKYEACNPGSPQAGAETNAAKYKIKAYANLDTIKAMQRSLVVNGPFVVGTSVYKNWMDPNVAATGKIPLPGSSEFIGGHAICIVGFDDETQMFKFKNSWGTSWGDNGFGYLPYDYRIQTQAEHFFFEAYSATDLIDNVDALVGAKEKILQQMGEEFKEEVELHHWGGDQVIKYH